jgi:hypothetical protein
VPIPVRQSVVSIPSRRGGAAAAAHLLSSPSPALPACLSPFPCLWQGRLGICLSEGGEVGGWYASQYTHGHFLGGFG